MRLHSRSSAPQKWLAAADLSRGCWKVNCDSFGIIITNHFWFWRFFIVNWYILTQDVHHLLWFPAWLRTKIAAGRSQVKSDIMWLHLSCSSGRHFHRFKDKIWYWANARHMGGISPCTQGMKQLQELSCSHLQCLTISMLAAWIQPLPAPSQLVLWYNPETSMDQSLLPAETNKSYHHGLWGCLMPTEEQKDNEHTKQTVAMQRLQSIRSCGYLLHLIPAASQCAWETFHDSLPELLTQKVNDWTIASFHFQE